MLTITGAMFGRRATWIGASGDQTFLRVDESLINAHTLAKSNVFANQSCIGQFCSMSIYMSFLCEGQISQP